MMDLMVQGKGVSYLLCQTDLRFEDFWKIAKKKLLHARYYDVIGNLFMYHKCEHIKTLIIFKYYGLCDQPTFRIHGKEQ